MSIGALYEDHRFAAADYEAVMAQLQGSRPRGCLVHIGGPTESAGGSSRSGTRRTTSGAFRRTVSTQRSTRLESPPSVRPSSSVHTILPPPEALSNLPPGT